MVEPNEPAADQQRALDRIRPLAEQLGLYLARGTALAFHLRHRTSRDVDLFSLEPDLDLEDVRRCVVAEVGAEIDSLTNAALHCRVDDVPIDVVRYPYRLLDPPVVGPSGVLVAGLDDLATMKLSAASRRGIRRDFWDLHEMFERHTPSLDEALDCYRRRFGRAEADLYHVLRSLTYFDDAEADPLYPAGLTVQRWETIKTSMLEHARSSLARRISPDA